MSFQRFSALCVLVLFGMGAFHNPQVVKANEVQSAPAQQVSAYELILAMNTLRVSYGLPALIEDPIVNAVAQNTAAIMAANNMSWHIGDVRGRIASAVAILTGRINCDTGFGMDPTCGVPPMEGDELPHSCPET